MAIPDYQTLMRPFLELIKDGEDHSMKYAVDQLARQFMLSEEEISELLPSGQQTILKNRVSWARTYLKYAGLVDSAGRGFVRITPAGLKLLKTHRGPIQSKDLEQFPSFLEFKNKSVPVAGEEVGLEQKMEPLSAGLTPQEQMEAAFEQSRQSTRLDLLQRLKSCSPGYFERVVVELLMKMGYGGIAGKGEVTRFSSDGGIDGIINQDKLGLDVVSIQAKRWESTVGRPIVQGFVGSMDYIRARKGVIITTSKFSREAEDYVERIEGKKVVLIDGDELSELMIDHNLGVTIRKTYELKEVSNDFFDED